MCVLHTKNGAKCWRSFLAAHIPSCARHTHRMPHASRWIDTNSPESTRHTMSGRATTYMEHVHNGDEEQYRAVYRILSRFNHFVQFIRIHTPHSVPSYLRLRYECGEFSMRRQTEYYALCDALDFGYHLLFHGEKRMMSFLCWCWYRTSMRDYNLPQLLNYFHLNVISIEAISVHRSINEISWSIGHYYQS